MALRAGPVRGGARPSAYGREGKAWLEVAHCVLGLAPECPIDVYGPAQVSKRSLDLLDIHDLPFSDDKRHLEERNKQSCSVKEFELADVDQRTRFFAAGLMSLGWSARVCVNGSGRNSRSDR